MFQADSGQGGYGEAGYEAQIKTSGAKEKLLAHLEPSVLAEVRTQKREQKREAKREAARSDEIQGACIGVFAGSHEWSGLHARRVNRPHQTTVTCVHESTFVCGGV
jgi:hypothetical protein